MYFIRREDTTEPVNDAEPFEYGGVSLFSHQVYGEYRVTEAITGLMLTASDDSKENAVKKAKSFIDKNPDLVKSKIREALKRIASETSPMVTCEI
ncbi:MAG: hypothetical protein WC623_22030 [Pedobacter sp.]|uniref:hypothetical protein n=1 Tax=Pedobacter sp. TaxID=1411316 RepID=UPI003567297F